MKAVHIRHVASICANVNEPIVKTRRGGGLVPKIRPKLRLGYQYQVPIFGQLAIFFQTALVKMCVGFWQ